MSLPFQQLLSHVCVRARSLHACPLLHCFRLGAFAPYGYYICSSTLLGCSHAAACSRQFRFLPSQAWCWRDFACGMGPFGDVLPRAGLPTTSCGSCCCSMHVRTYVADCRQLTQLPTCWSHFVRFPQCASPDVRLLLRNVLGQQQCCLLTKLPACMFSLVDTWTRSVRCMPSLLVHDCCKPQQLQSRSCWCCRPARRHAFVLLPSEHCFWWCWQLFMRPICALPVGVTMLHNTLWFVAVF